MSSEKYMDITQIEIQELKNIYTKHTSEGCFLPWEEWEEKVRRAYAVLIDIARRVPYERITITYAELGHRIGLFPLSDWFQLKIAWILHACAEYAHKNGYPMIN